MGLFRRKREAPIRQPHITSQNEAYSFRRSRTLTGSSADVVRSAGENRAQIKSPRIKVHELRSHRRRLLLYLVVVLALAFGGWTLLGQYTGYITTVATSASNSPAIQGKYLGIMNDYFAGRPFERFRFALRSEDLSDYLKQKAPEVASMELSGTAQPGTSHLAVQFRKPVVVWEIARQKYYVDAQGHAFRQNYYSEPGVIVKDQSGIDPAAGAIASNRFLHFLGRVVALIDASGSTRVSGVVIPPNTTREVDLQLADRGYIVKTQLDRDPAEQVSDVLNAMRYLDNKGIKPQYIDVRVSGKAYYK